MFPDHLLTNMSAWVNSQAHVYASECWQVYILCSPARQIVIMLQFMPTWLHLLVRSTTQEIPDSQRPTSVFVLLYLYQPKCQNKYNLLEPDSVPNYTPQKTDTKCP